MGELGRRSAGYALMALLASLRHARMPGLRASSIHSNRVPQKRDGDRIAQHPSTALRAGSAKLGSPVRRSWANWGGGALGTLLLLLGWLPCVTLECRVCEQVRYASNRVPQKRDGDRIAQHAAGSRFAALGRTGEAECWVDSILKFEPLQGRHIGMSRSQTTS